MPDESIVEQPLAISNTGPLISILQSDSMDLAVTLAEVMVLAGRPEYSGCIMLLDERAARAVAAELDLKVSGFAGILLLAASEKLLTADEVKNKLKQCQQLGTHYGDVFIQQVYQAAKEGNNEGEKRNGT